MILNTKRSSHWLDGAVFSPACVRYKVREVKAGWGSMRGRSTACFSRLTGGRDVDAGVLVMYTKVCLQARNFRLFYLFSTLGVYVFLRNGVVWRIHFIFLFFSCFFTVAIVYITQSHYSHFP